MTCYLTGCRELRDDPDAEDGWGYDMATGYQLTTNLAVLEAELGWFEAVLNTRLATCFGSDPLLAAATTPPQLDDGSALGKLVAATGLDADERLVLILALIPSLRPRLLDPLLIRNNTLDREFTDFGGTKSQSHLGFLPTGETASFLVAGDDLGARAAVYRWFGPDHVFYRHDLVRLVNVAAGEPLLSGALVPGDGLLALLTTGVANKAHLSRDFPAQWITTALDWTDLVLSPKVHAELQTIIGWMTHGQAIMADWRLGCFLKPGYRSVFYGPPGTGKTLTAILLGKATGRDVLRVDLSMILSKHILETERNIGETERNLARVFDRALLDDAILFFDEADALFGKRTAIASSTDRYPNQEAASFLQRVEDFRGNVILASNLKSNIDDAFARCFQSFVLFPLPDVQQRLALWRGLFADASRVGPDVDFVQLAEAHVLSGGAIANVARFAAITALRDGRAAVAAADLELGVVKNANRRGMLTPHRRPTLTPLRRA